MKTFDTLYKRTKTGAIQSYEIEVLTSSVHPIIVKYTGQLNGKKTAHDETVREGKNLGKANETTAVEQAISQAESDWKRKKDEGYKSLKDLGIVIAGPTDEAIKQGGQAVENFFQRLKSMLEASLPQFNTDANGNVKPMLAKAVNWDKVKYPCLVQPKLDGVRCLMISDGDDVIFLSRSGKEYTTLDHIKLDVIEYIIKYENSSPDKNVFILDGEIYSDEISFQEIIAAVKKQRPDSLKLKFRAYDIVNDEKQSDRWAETVHLVDAIGSPHVWPVTTFIADNKEAVKEFHDTWVSEGYEGAMIRHTDGIYGQGQRSSDLLKVKEFDDSEFMCVGLGTGQREEDVLLYCETLEGKSFNAKLTGTREYKADLVKNWDNNRNKLVTIKHFGWTDDGLPRFPIGKAFRED